MVELGWPLVALGIWTFLIRWFPSILGKAFEKRIEYRYDRKLEEIKTKLQASYATLKTSVDFLSTTQSELRSKIIKSTENLWGAVFAVENEFNDIVFVDSILLPEEIDDAFSGESDDDLIGQLAKSYGKFEAVEEKLNQAKALGVVPARLFVGDRLWLVYKTIISVHGRFGFLIYKSFEQNRYVNWRNDQPMSTLLESCLKKDVVDNIKRAQVMGFSIAIGHLEAEFLKEATRVMSGSQGFADSLSDVHAVLQYQNQEIAARRDSSASA